MQKRLQISNFSKTTSLIINVFRKTPEKRGYLELRWELDDGGAEVEKFNPFPHLLPSKFPGAETEAEEGELSGDSEEAPPVLHRWHRHPVASATVLVLQDTVLCSVTGGWSAVMC